MNDRETDSLTHQLEALRLLAVLLFNDLSEAADGLPEEHRAVQAYECLDRATDLLAEALEQLRKGLLEVHPAVETAGADAAAPRIAVTDNRERLLFEDMLRLSQLGDMEGVLISFERLLVLFSLSDRVQRLVAENEEELLGLYGKHLFKGLRLDQVMVHRLGRTEGNFGIVGWLLSYPAIAHVEKLVDNESTIEQLARMSPLKPIEVVAYLVQLQRMKMLSFRLDG